MWFSNVAEPNETPIISGLRARERLTPTLRESATTGPRVRVSAPTKEGHDA
jgi:hypothetical protein